MPEQSHLVMYLSECISAAKWHTTVHTDIDTLINQFLFFKEESNMHILAWPKRSVTKLRDAPDKHSPLFLCLLRPKRLSPPAKSPLQPDSVGLGLKGHPNAVLSQWDSSDKMIFFSLFLLWNLPHFLLSQPSRPPDQPMSATAEPHSSLSSHPEQLVPFCRPTIPWNCPSNNSVCACK